MDASSSIGAGGHASATIPVLFGFSYSPRALAITPALRPYLSAAAGPYTHFFTGALFDHLSAGTETQHFADTDASTPSVSGFGMTLGLGFT